VTTAVKEKPILFSSEMVNAILDGRKTQTRRIMKPQPKYFDKSPHWRWKHSSKFGPIAVASGDRPSIFGKFVPGERLWVREAWAETTDGEVFYRATDEDDFREPPPWRPSIFMPRKHSRITLEVTGVRVERLNEMKSADVVAEGFPFASDLDAFKVLWNKLNNKPGFRWADSPWVWVISFRRIEP